MGLAKQQNWGYPAKQLQWVPKLSPEEKAEQEKKKAEIAAAKANKPTIPDAKIFLGRWKDSLGNIVEVEKTVEESGVEKKALWSEMKESDEVPAAKPSEILVKLTRRQPPADGAVAVQPKILKIIVDPKVGRWRCGNGILERLDYKGSVNNLPTAIWWQSKDRRISKWERIMIREGSQKSKSPSSPADPEEKKSEEPAKAEDALAEAETSGQKSPTATDSTASQ